LSTNQSVYNGIVPKSSEETRKRLLAAATKEFAQYGIAGARVDRIAEAAGANKQAIYAYFGSKESLFDAVYDAMVVQTMEEVPIDAYDLPGYVGRLYDRYRRHPEVLRIATWYAMERGIDAPHPSSLRSSKAKTAKIREAQKAGAITTDFTPEDILVLILNLSTTGHRVSPESLSPDRSHDAVKKSIMNAVERFTHP
jgi:AcrR family transcriptional regulator